MRAVEADRVGDADGVDQSVQQSLESFAKEDVASSTVTLTDMSLEETPTFEELGVDRLLVSCLSASGIEVPSPIQEAAIPQLLQGHNAAVQSYTGSGKTLAYLLPALTLALQRAEAAFRRQRAAAARGRTNLAERDAWTVQVLVVAPSQELAMQICRVAASLLPKDSRGAVQQAIGGANMRRQAEAIAEQQPLVVVGTPGRLADLIRMGALRLHRCPIMILDEADQLLGDVYSADMTHIVEHCGKRLAPTAAAAAGGKGSKKGGSNKDAAKQSEIDNSASSNSGSTCGSSGDSAESLLLTKRQTVLVSATLWAGVLSRFAAWCPEPRFITMGGSPTYSLEDSDQQGSGGKGSGSDAAKAWGWGAKGWEGPASVVQAGPKTQGMAGGAEGSGLVPTLPPNLEHRYMVVNPQHKADAMRRAMYALNAGMGLGFMNWQQRLKDVAAKVAAKKIEVGQLHGEMSPSERAAVLEGARRGAFQLLLVSDVAARGIDMPQIDVVFNIELPTNAAHYAHRAGRTGRMGAPGLVLTLVAPGERFVVERLSKKLAVPILECHLAGGELVVGPPAAKEKEKEKKKKKEIEQAKEQQEQEQQLIRAALSERQQSNSQASSSSSSGPKATAAAAKPGSAAAAQTAAAAAAEDVDSEDGEGEYILDEDDDVEVEGDEPLDAYRERLKRELQSEIEEIKREKAAARQQRYKQQQEAAAAGEGGEAGRQVRQRSVRKLSGPYPKGSPQEAAAMAMAAIKADEKARNSKSKLPAAVLEALGELSEGSAEDRAGQKQQRSGGRQKQQQQRGGRRGGRSAGNARPGRSQ